MLWAYFIWDGTTLCLHYGGFSTALKFNAFFSCANGAFPLSKAGVRSTSRGMMPLLSKENMPSWMSFSVMGGGSANGSSRKFLGRILLAKKILLGLRVPIPSFSSSMLLIPPYDLPYLKRFGCGREYLSLRRLCPVVLSGSRVEKVNFCSFISTRTGLERSSISSVGVTLSLICCIDFVL